MPAPGCAVSVSEVGTRNDVSTKPAAIRSESRSRSFPSAASGVAPSALKLRGSPLLAKKPPPRLGSSRTGISIEFASLRFQTATYQRIILPDRPRAWNLAASSHIMVEASAIIDRHQVRSRPGTLAIRVREAPCEENFAMSQTINRRSFLYGTSVAGFGIFAQGRHGWAGG